MTKEGWFRSKAWACLGSGGARAVLGPHKSHLEVAIDQKVGLKVIVILSEGVDELLSYLSGEGGGRRGPENPSPPHPWSPGLGAPPTLSQPA